MYHKVLLAYDGSRESRAALREGALLGHRLGAELHLLAVVADPARMVPDGGMYAQQMAGDWQEPFEAILREAVEYAGKLGVELKANLLKGEATELIAAYAHKIGADLVVVGYTKQSLLRRWWSGPAGAVLSEQLDCSLMIARNEMSRGEFAQELKTAS